MPNWLKSMTQTFEYYPVDPGTWRDLTKIDFVKSCTINRDLDVETLGSATIDVTEPLGECYIRVYLITIQNGIREKHPLGTYLAQTTSTSFDGKSKTVPVDAYTPLIELKEKQPPIGYSLLKDQNIMDVAYRICRENLRAPVVKAECDEKLYSDFVSDPSEKWTSFVTDLIANAKYSLDVDELGRVLFAPKQDTPSLQPVWTYKDDNSSILYANFDMDHDLYGIPNVVEVVYSSGSENYYSRVVNDDPNSPTSTVNRGREILYRVENPSMMGNPTKRQIDIYAKQLLKDLSTLEYTVSYTHGYCPVRVGDCVRLNYERFGLTDVKAKVISQSIKCTSGCPVTEKAIFTKKLWG